MSLFEELKRRNVFRVGAAYAVAAWLLIQVAETIFPLFGFGDTPARIVVIVLAIGFVPAVILAWAFELTPGGLRKDRDVVRSDSTGSRTGKRLDRMIIAGLTLALAYFAFDKFVLDPARDAALRQATLNEAGTNATPAVRIEKAVLVTTFPGAHSEPTLSPDGQRMAFVSPDNDGVAQIWVMSLPDGNPVQITHGEMAAAQPSWSPTRDEILFSRATDSFDPSLWLVDALGAGTPRIIVSGGGDARFAPDGQSFVFTRGRGIWVGSRDGSPPRPLEGIPRTQGFARPMPAINAAGDIVFVLADAGPVGDLWLYESASGEFRRLTHPEGEWPGVDATWPVWMPDGRAVVYTAPNEERTNTQLWLIDTTSGTSNMISAGPGGYARPSVSGNGSRLVYAHQRPVWRLRATDPRSGEARMILETRNPIILPDVSPNGDTVVYFGEHVYTVPVAGGRAEQRTFGPPGEATLPTWSRSDQSIWYYKGRTLHRLAPVTGLSELMLEDFHWSRQNWLAVHGDRVAYNVRDSGPSVVRDLSSGIEVALGHSIFPTQWSRDGKRLLAMRWEDGTVVVCEAPLLVCSPIESEGDLLTGRAPRWSWDESRVFAMNILPDSDGHFEIWSAPVAGGTARYEATIGPLEPANNFFGIAKGDQIIWNEFDENGVSEIWMSDDLGGL